RNLQRSSIYGPRSGIARAVAGTGRSDQSAISGRCSNGDGETRWVVRKLKSRANSLFVSAQPKLRGVPTKEKAGERIPRCDQVPVLLTRGRGSGHSCRAA